MLNLSPPVLVGEKVILRPWHPDDAPALATAWSDPVIAASSKPPIDRSVEAAGRWIADAAPRAAAAVALDLVIADPVDARVMGEVGISRIDQARRAALIGWWVSEAERGRHIATDAVDLVARWLLDRGGFRALLAEIGPANEASLRVARRAGFVELQPSNDGQPAIFVSRA